MLIGKTGSGKSRTGNLLLGDELFEVKSSINSITTKVSSQSIELRPSFKRRLFDKQTHLRVIDTPGLFDTSKSTSNEDILSLIADVAKLAPEGIHAVIIMIDGTVRFNEQEAETIDLYSKQFNSELFDYSFIAQKQRMPTEEEINANLYLKPIVLLCENRQVEVNIGIEEKVESKIMLEMKITDIVNQQSKPLSDKLFEEILNQIWQNKAQNIIEPLGVTAIGTVLSYYKIALLPVTGLSYAGQHLAKSQDIEMPIKFSDVSQEKFSHVQNNKYYLKTQELFKEMSNMEFQYSKINSIKSFFTKLYQVNDDKCINEIKFSQETCNII